MFEIQQRFIIKSPYTLSEIADKFAAFEAEVHTDMFGAKNYYIESLDKTSREECPILCKVYANDDGYGCELHFTVGDKDFWAKKIQFLPVNAEMFVVKMIFGSAFWIMFTLHRPIMLLMGFLVVLAIYSVNNVYPREAYNRYQKICFKQKEAMQNLFQKTKGIDDKVRNLIDEIGT